MIQLDTSFLIRALVRGSQEDRRLREWLSEGASVSVSCIAWTELLCGPIERAEVDLARRVVAEVLPYTEEDAVRAAELFNDTGRRRGSLVDCMIAATAIRENARLATTNIADFRRFAERDLVVESA